MVTGRDWLFGGWLKDSCPPVTVGGKGGLTNHLYSHIHGSITSHNLLATLLS